MSTLQLVGRSLLRVPDDFEVHKDVHKLLKQRERVMETGEGVSMALAESLAFGCLMTKYSPKIAPKPSFADERAPVDGSSSVAVSATGGENNPQSTQQGTGRPISTAKLRVG